MKRFMIIICYLALMQFLYVTVESAPIGQNGFTYNGNQHFGSTDFVTIPNEAQSESTTDDPGSLPRRSARPPNDTPKESDSYYSPYLLYKSWSPSKRLLLFFIIFFEGLITNLFFVSSFFLHKVLKRQACSIYLACTGAADVCLTCGVALPACLVLLSVHSNYRPGSVPDDDLHACLFVYFMGSTSTYMNSFFYALTALETYARVCWRTRTHARCLQLLPPRLLSLITLLFACFLAYADVYWKLNVDYCERHHTGHFVYRTATTVICHLLPFFITVLGFARVITKIVKNARKQIQYKRSRRYSQDLNMASAILISYLVYALFWTPHLLVSHLYPDISDKTFYLTAWTGSSRSVFSFIIYIIFVKSFQEAFLHFFRNLCIKSNMPTDTGTVLTIEEAPASYEMHSGVSPPVHDAGGSQGLTPSNSLANTPDSSREVASTSTYGLASNSTLALTSPLGIASTGPLEIASITPTEAAREEDRMTGIASKSTQIQGVTSSCTQTEEIALHQRVTSSSRPKKVL